MRSRSASDKLRIAMAAQSLARAGVTPTPKMVSRVLGWHTSVRPYWNDYHSAMLLDVLKELGLLNVCDYHNITHLQSYNQGNIGTSPYSIVAQSTVDYVIRY